MAVALYNTKDAQHTALLGLFSLPDEDEILENGLNQLLFFVSAYFLSKKTAKAYASCSWNYAQETR